MSTTKYKLADQALRILSGGDVQNATDTQIREMMIAVSQARDYLVRQEVWMLIQQADVFDVPGEYITTYDDVQVKWDDKYKIMYSKLPAKYLNLPRNLGVYSVSLTEDMWNAFVPVSPNFRSLYNGLGASSLESRIGYWVERGKIFFQGMDKSDNIGDVSIKLIVASNEIDDEDEVFPIPADKEMEVVKLALEMYGLQKQVPNDEINDNIDE
jgi:hypothetical protein